MADITIHLDEETEKRARNAAEASGEPVEKWIADVIQERTAAKWPQSLIDAIGTWSDDDFPSLEELRNYPPDLPREEW
jgi:hypothetical protein